MQPQQLSACAPPELISTVPKCASAWSCTAALAIYINGVANELYEMTCATPKVFKNDAVSGTRDLYRKASLLLGSVELRTRYAEHLRDP